MREPHKKGVAHHFGSESCTCIRKEAGEALTGVHTARYGAPKSPLRCADLVLIWGRQHEGQRKARAVLRHRGVRDPRHVGKLHARESGGPTDAHTGWQCGTVEEGEKP